MTPRYGPRAAARAQIYSRLAHGPAEDATRLHSGDLVARVGADVDQLADVLVRSALPFGVAAVLALAATAAVGVISPPAAALLAICLLVAGIVAPWLAAKAATAQEAVARQHHSARDVAAMLALEHAPELRVAGRLPSIVLDSQRRQRAWSDAIDAAVRPAALATAMPTAAIGASVLGAVVAAIGLAGSSAPTTLGHLDAVAAVRVRGDNAVGRRCCSVDALADSGTTSTRLDAGHKSDAHSASPTASGSDSDAERPQGVGGTLRCAGARRIGDG